MTRSTRRTQIDRANRAAQEREHCRATLLMIVVEVSSTATLTAERRVAVVRQLLGSLDNDARSAATELYELAESEKSAVVARAFGHAASAFDRLAGALVNIANS